MAELTIHLTLPNAAGALQVSCRADVSVGTLTETLIGRFGLPPNRYRLRVLQGDVAEDLDPAMSLRQHGISHGASLWLDGGGYIQSVKPAFTSKVGKVRGLGDRQLQEAVEVNVEE